MTARRTPPSEITVQDICNTMETWAPQHLAYDWDKPGLTIGDPQQNVSRISVMLSVTPETVAAALKAKADLIISHHPVIWEPLAHLRETDAHTRMCLQLVRSGIACYAAHTNLDMAPGGVNDILAKTLGLVHCKPLFPRHNQATTPSRSLKVVTFIPPSHHNAVRNAVCQAGAGSIGNYTHCTFSSPGTGTFLPGKKIPGLFPESQAPCRKTPSSASK